MFRSLYRFALAFNQALLENERAAEQLANLCVPPPKNAQHRDRCCAHRNGHTSSNGRRAPEEDIDNDSSARKRVNTGLPTQISKGD